MQPASGIIDEHKQRARSDRGPQTSDDHCRRSGSARHNTRAAAAAGWNVQTPLLARQPEAGIRHPLAQRLARHRKPVLGQLLGGQCRPKVRVTLPNQLQRQVTHAIMDAVVRTAATATMTQRRRTFDTECPKDPLHLANTQRQHNRRRSKSCGVAKQPPTKLQYDAARARSSKSSPKICFPNLVDDEREGDTATFLLCRNRTF